MGEDEGGGPPLGLLVAPGAGPLHLAPGVPEAHQAHLGVLGRGVLALSGDITRLAVDIPVVV